MQCLLHYNFHDESPSTDCFNMTRQYRKNTPLLVQLQQQLILYQQRPLFIAYSGGLDSHVLLVLLHQLRQQQPLLNLTAIHIHHGLNQQADAWAAHCQHICDTLKINCVIKKVNLIAQKKQGIEAAARTARYQMLFKVATDNGVILTAQHRNDQAETVLLQLLRGAGSKGLAAMPFIRKQQQQILCRPLLNCSQQSLRDFAQQQQLTWIEDDSNQDVRFNRNFLRHNIMPLLRHRWESVDKVLYRVAQQQAENDELLMELAVMDWQQCKSKNQQCLTITKLQQLNPARQKNLLRYWLDKKNFPLPSHQQLQQLQQTQQLSYANKQIKSYQNQLFAFAKLPDKPQKTLIWQSQQPLTLPLGELHFNGKGCYHFTVKFRQGGETIKVNQQQQSIKNWLQKKSIPPWLRDYVPFIYYQEQLICVVTVVTTDTINIDVEFNWQSFFSQ